MHETTETTVHLWNVNSWPVQALTKRLQHHQEYGNGLLISHNHGIDQPCLEKCKWHYADNDENEEMQ